MATGYYSPISYAPAKPVTSAAFTLPTMPSIPAVSRPLNAQGQPIANPATAPAWGNLTAQLSYLPGLFNPQRTQAKANVQSALAGLGGFTWGTDNPATPQDESLNVSYNPNHQLGQAERNVYHQTIANIPSGLMGSSIANRAIGTAFQQLSDQERQILSNYQAQLGQIATNQFTAGQNITNQMLDLYGTDTTWYTDPNQPWNQAPPPAPPAPPEPPSVPNVPEGGPIPAGYGGPGGIAAQQGLYYGVGNPGAHGRPLLMF